MSSLGYVVTARSEQVSARDRPNAASHGVTFQQRSRQSLNARGHTEVAMMVNVDHAMDIELSDTITS